MKYRRRLPTLLVGFVFGCGGDAEGCEGGSGFESQDCRLAPGYNDFSAACVNHRCLSFVSGPH
jgi:hypothetical protein